MHYLDVWVSAGYVLNGILRTRMVTTFSVLGGFLSANPYSSTLLLLPHFQNAYLPYSYHLSGIYLFTLFILPIIYISSFHLISYITLLYTYNIYTIQ